MVWWDDTWNKRFVFRYKPQPFSIDGTNLVADAKYDWTSHLFDIHNVFGWWWWKVACTKANRLVALKMICRKNHLSTQSDWNSPSRMNSFSKFMINAWSMNGTTASGYTWTTLPERKQLENNWVFQLNLYLDESTSHNQYDDGTGTTPLCSTRFFNVAGIVTAMTSLMWGYPWMFWSWSKFSARDVRGQSS